MVEHHSKDNGHDIAHHPLLFLLVGHQAFIFGSRSAEALLRPHDASKKKWQQVEVGAKEDDRDSSS